ncbi:histone deacetylase 6-like [Gigantopelta aegis]|uniref:histone deacetylase 6-like n=1 Tax=Gigantopelta aegis TaxID=1735272 RepID=UPI001B888C15|nr:histone deacetylase 6-like [Gigantopelta aegis]
MSDKDPEVSSGDGVIRPMSGETQNGEDDVEKTLTADIGRGDQDTDKAPESDDEDLQLLMGMCCIKDSSEHQPETVNGTCFLYDELMMKHKHEWCGDYPERPERISQPYARCCQLGLVDRCEILEMRYATEDHILIKHSQELLEKTKSLPNMSLSELLHVSEQYSSWFANNSTYECALAALGSTVEVMEHILKKKSRNGFAMIRPPGHHAMFNEYCGYCTFNNVAIAAQHALDRFGLERILVVDWDIHHGQGTQYMFYDDPRVLYFSIHRYEHGAFWPELRESDYDFVGKGKGKGYNINVPLNKMSMTDSDYLAIFYQILLPVAYQYSPQLIIVSSGFDAVIGCPEFAPHLILVSNGLDSAIGDRKGEMLVSPVMYAHFVHMLSPVCQGRLCVVLEGGYCLKSLSEGCALVLRSLLGDPCPLMPPIKEPCDSVIETILNVIKVLRPYWQCFQYQEELTPRELCPFDGVNELPPKPGIVFATEANRPEKYDIDDYFLFDEQTAADFDKQIDVLIAETCLTKAPHRTCLLFDADMRAHRDTAFRSHPERPDRISSIFNVHVEWGLYKRCHSVQSRLATEEEILLIHSETYLNEMKKTAEMELSVLQVKQREFNSIYFCKDTYRCALLSAGSVLSVVETVLSGQAQSGVAIVRPPGHHAESSTAMGFCYFNNIAIAAKYAQNKFGVKRILILDWDVHHGNGTQHQFYDDDSVLFISLHRYDHGFFYPKGDDGNYDNVGRLSGEGFNINIPWNKTDREQPGTSEYIAAFHQIVMPVAYEFAPELVLVSAGFDAARGDPLGGLDVTPECYGQMTHMLSGLANGKVVLILEGGYNLNSISASMAMCTSVLLGNQCPLVPPPTVCSRAVETICNVLDVQKQYWKSLKFRVKLPPVSQLEQKNSVTSEETEKQILPSSGDETVSEALHNLKVNDDDKVVTQNTDEGDLPCADAPSSGNAPSSGDAPRSGDAPCVGDTLCIYGAGESATKEELEGACGGVDQSMTLQDYFHLPVVDQMYAVQPLPWCPHLDSVQPLPQRGLDVEEPCEECGDLSENWVCLECYKVFCSRFVKEHMLFHGLESEHRVVLSYADLSVWCYGCDNYVNNKIIFPMKQEAHRKKFGGEIPE